MDAERERWIHNTPRKENKSDFARHRRTTRNTVIPNPAKNTMVMIPKNMLTKKGQEWSEEKRDCSRRCRWMARSSCSPTCRVDSAGNTSGLRTAIREHSSRKKSSFFSRDVGSSRWWNKSWKNFIARLPSSERGKRSKCFRKMDFSFVKESNEGIVSTTDWIMRAKSRIHSSCCWVREQISG